jgi:hypothetical protein
MYLGSRGFLESKELQDFILDFFGSMPKDKVPRLSLKKIREEERDKFPTS